MVKDIHSSTSCNTHSRTWRVWRYLVCIIGTKITHSDWGSFFTATVKRFKNSYGSPIFERLAAIMQEQTKMETYCKEMKTFNVLEIEGQHFKFEAHAVKDIE